MLCLILLTNLVMMAFGQTEGPLLEGSTVSTTTVPSVSTEQLTTPVLSYTTGQSIFPDSTSGHRSTVGQDRYGGHSIHHNTHASASDPNTGETGVKQSRYFFHINPFEGLAQVNSDSAVGGINPEEQTASFFQHRHNARVVPGHGSYTNAANTASVSPLGNLAYQLFRASTGDVVPEGFFHNRRLGQLLHINHPVTGGVTKTDFTNTNAFYRPSSFHHFRNPAIFNQQIFGNRNNDYYRPSPSGFRTVVPFPGYDNTNRNQYFPSSETNFQDETEDNKRNQYPATEQNNFQGNQQDFNQQFPQQDSFSGNGNQDFNQQNQAFGQDGNDPNQQFPSSQQDSFPGNVNQAFNQQNQAFGQEGNQNQAFGQNGNSNQAFGQNGVENQQFLSSQQDSFSGNANQDYNQQNQAFGQDGNQNQAFSQSGNPNQAFGQDRNQNQAFGQGGNENQQGYLSGNGNEGFNGHQQIQTPYQQGFGSDQEAYRGNEYFNQNSNRNQFDNTQDRYRQNQISGQDSFGGVGFNQDDARRNQLENSYQDRYRSNSDSSPVSYSNSNNEDERNVQLYSRDPSRSDQPQLQVQNVGLGYSAEEQQQTRSFDAQLNAAGNRFNQENFRNSGYGNQPQFYQGQALQSYNNEQDTQFNQRENRDYYNQPERSSGTEDPNQYRYKPSEAVESTDGQSNQGYPDNYNGVKK